MVVSFSTETSGREDTEGLISEESFVNTITYESRGPRT